MDGLHLIIFFRGYVHIIILHWVIMKMNITLDVLFIGTMTDVNISWYDTNFPSNPMQLTASSYILSYVMYYVLKYYSIYERIKTGYSQVHSIGGLGRGGINSRYVYRLFWGTEARSDEVNKHISPRCLKITYLLFTYRSFLCSDRGILGGNIIAGNIEYIPL